MTHQLLTFIFIYSCFISSFQQNLLQNVETVKLSRHKRFISTGREWTNGIVPFVYTSSIGVKEKLEIESAMHYVEKYSCIRFVPWTNQTSRRYNLDHNGYVNFINKDSCYSSVGNRRGPQDCSCCDRFSCVHELGHVLGLQHSHHSHIADGWIRINWKEIRKSHMYVYRYIEEAAKEYEYDITSMMHYPEYMYKTSHRQTISNLVRSLKIGGNRFYALRDINWFHRCQDKRCNWFYKKCYNGGYITTIDGRCSCKCPLRLDPKTGCRTIIKQRKKNIWPSGHFALMAPDTGCPDGKFATGSMTHWGDGANWHKFTYSKTKRITLHLKGVHNAKRHTYYFCVSKNYSPLGGEWPAGSYCILREGGFCPYKFTEGSVKFDNVIRSRRQSNSHQGELPDGMFEQDTTLEFCCRDDGLPEEPMELPNDKPIILYHAKSLGNHRCQEVSGMSYVQEYFIFDTVDKNKNGTSKISGKPPRYHKYAGEKYLLYYCYYEPIDYNCGGVFNINKNNPTMTVTSPNYPSNYSVDQECLWLFKAPKDSKLVLKFQDFDVEEGASGCVDTVAVGTGLIGQIGKGLCGSWNRAHYFSIYNIINVRFRSSISVNNRGFKAKISLISAEENCYSWKDRGTSYRGKVSITETQAECLPWVQMTDCPHHSFRNGDYKDGLEENYCRNPGDGLRPWCYIEKDGCVRQYCDVCMSGEIHDRLPDCEEMKNKTTDFCTSDFRAASDCRLTCNKELSSLPSVNKVNTVKCTQPPIVKDGYVTRGLKAQYDVGNVIEYKCKVTNDTVSSMCLDDATWSSMGFVCGACPKGWSVFRKNCYKYFNEEMLWVKADEYCRSLDGVLTTAVDPTENKFILTLRKPLHTFWIGLDDRETEGTFVWSNGRVASWTNFIKGSPNNLYNAEHCVAVLSEEKDSKWEDKYCKDHRKHAFICKVKPKNRFVCSDRLSNCKSMLKQVPAMCVDQVGFSWSECPNTCGMCDKHRTKKCRVPKTPDNVMTISTRRHLYRGKVVRYECSNGYTVVSGDLDRVCRSDGTLSGQAPVCKPLEMTSTLSSPVTLKDRGEFGGTGYVYTGKTPELLITRNGTLLEWHFYTSYPGIIALQIYRPPKNSSSNSFTLISSILVTPKPHRIERIIVPKARQVAVEPGDLLAAWTDSKTAGASMVGCHFLKSSTHVKKANVKKYSDFRIGTKVKFSGKSECKIISLRALIGPIDN